MPYVIHLEQGGGVLDEIVDRDSWLEECAFAISSEAWRLGDLDPAGTTWFNRIQAPRLLEEVAMLKPHARTDANKALLVRLEEMLERCRDGMDLFVVFRGAAT
jgi:hypothetical protein